MNESIHKALLLIFGVAVVLVLLLDGGGALAGNLVEHSEIASGGPSASSWVWIAPTLLIFGLGFLLGWLVFGNVPRNETSARAKSISEEGVLTQRKASRLAAAELTSSRR